MKLCEGIQIATSSTHWDTLTTRTWGDVPVYARDQPQIMFQKLLRMHGGWWWTTSKGGVRRVKYIGNHS